MRSQFENHLNFGKTGNKSDPKDPPQPQDQIEKKEAQLDMLLASQRIDDRLGSLSRLRTAINFNEIIRLMLILIGTFKGFQNSLQNKDLLKVVIDVQTQLLSKRDDILDDNIVSIDPWSLYPQETMIKLARQKLIEFVISFFILILTLNYYRLVWKLTTLRDGLYRQDLQWVSIAIKCSLVFIHSQARWNYNETIQVGGEKGESPKSLYENRRIYYDDQIITAIMVGCRICYVVPKMVVRIYSITVRDYPKTKNRYIITEKTAVLDVWRYHIKYLFHFHKSVLLLIFIIQIIALSCIFQIFNWNSSESLIDFQDIKPSKSDEFYFSLFSAANLVLRQQFNIQMRTFFISDPPPAPEEQVDPNVQYITAEYLDPDAVSPEPLEQPSEEEEEDLINTSYQELKIYPENNILMTLRSLIAFVGSVGFTSFLINLLTQIDKPLSQRRVQNVMIDVLQNQRGLIRTYSASLIQAHFRIKVYQKKCNFEGMGTIRPGIENYKIYKKNRNLLLRNIGLFRYNKFLIKQYRERASGIDKFAVEYHWGHQPYSKSCIFRSHRFIQDSVKKLQVEIIDKMRYKTMVILNEKVGRNDVDLILKNQEETIGVLKQKLLAMRQTDIFLNKIQATYLKEDPYRVMDHPQYQRLTKIDTFPEIISETSVKQMSDREFAIYHEELDDKTTEQNRIQRSDHYSVENGEQLDRTSLKFKLLQLKKKLETDIAAGETSHRQINISIKGKNKVGFAKGTKEEFRKSNTKTGGSMQRRKSRRSSISGSKSRRSSRVHSLSAELKMATLEKSKENSPAKSAKEKTSSRKASSPKASSRKASNRRASSRNEIEVRTTSLEKSPSVTKPFQRLETVIEKQKQKAPAFRRLKTKKDGPSGGIFMGGGFNQIF